MSTDIPTPNPLSAQPGFDLNEARAERDRLAADLADAMQEIARWMRKSERVRAEVAEEIAAHLDRLAVATTSPTARRAWRCASEVARERAGKGFQDVAAGSAVPTEGSGHRCPATDAVTTPETWVRRADCDPDCTGHLPILSTDTPEGDTANDH